MTLKIVGLGGSLRPGSHTYSALELALNMTAGCGAEAELLDLRKLQLPFCHGGENYDGYPDVKKLRDAVQGAQAIVLATPEYHGSLSGILKNTLDLMGKEQLNGKVVGILSVMGGMASNNAANALRLICRSVHAWVIPEQIIISQAHRQFSEDGQLLDPALQARFDAFAQSLVTHARKLVTL